MAESLGQGDAGPAAIDNQDLVAGPIDRLLRKALLTLRASIADGCSTHHHKESPLYYLRQPKPEQLAELAMQQSLEAPSYTEVGRTLSPGVPAGYRPVQASRTVGNGVDCFTRSRSAIESWAGHRHTGAVLYPPQLPIETGKTVVVALKIGPVWTTAACRIVAVVDEPDRFGFAYGTLPHHSVRGEEAFLVTRDPTSGTVEFKISAFSSPKSVLTRLGGPIGRVVQRLMARRYLDGFQGSVVRST